MRPMEIISARLEDVRGSRARCRACGKAGALSFRETSDGKVLLKCFRGCTASEITAAIGLDVRALFVARTPLEHRDRAETEARELEDFKRDQHRHMGGALRRELGRIQQERAKKLGYYPPLRSIEVDRARRNVLRRLRGLGIAITLRDVPIPPGWREWTQPTSTSTWMFADAAVTEPAPWESGHPFDEDPDWPAYFMEAFDAELDHLRAVDPSFDLADVANVWTTLPHSLHRAALRAREAIRLTQRDSEVAAA